MSLIHSILHKITIGIFFILAILMIPFSISKFFNRPIYIDKRAMPFFKQFERDVLKYNAKASFYKLTTTFVKKLPNGTAAFCRARTNTVVISLESWQILSEHGRKALVYHELAHCALKREHVDALKIPFSHCPISIMHPYIDRVEFCFEKLEEEYIVELFTNPYNYESIPEEDQ